jgi:hypothetical protein
MEPNWRQMRLGAKVSQLGPFAFARFCAIGPRGYVPQGLFGSARAGLSLVLVIGRYRSIDIATFLGFVLPKQLRINKLFR